MEEERNAKLIICPNCSSEVSKRAIRCPNCELKLKEKCCLCKNEIAIDSQVCPQCGDPNPFAPVTTEQTINKCPKCGSGVSPIMPICENCGIYVTLAKKKPTQKKLLPCPLCNQQISDQAAQCPNCKVSTTQVCQVCEKEISVWSKDCPRCGDPEPFAQFAVLKDEVKPIPDNREINKAASQQIEKSPSVNQEKKKSNYTYNHNPAGLTTFLLTMLWILASVAVISIYFDWQQLKLINSDFISIDAAEQNDKRVSLAGKIYLIAYIITAISFLMWVYRANNNCHGFGTKDMRFTPSWSIWWYFIPFFNLFRPYQVMKEIYKVSSNPAEWKKQEGSNLLWIWWTAFIIAAIVGNYEFRTAIRSLHTEQTIEGIKELTVISIGSSVSMLFACLFAFLLIQNVGKRQADIVKAA